ncbi:hypothetical protein C5167_040800 [Papaver somniferum]|uniref:Uncharacterized protein n=1 Tax=Papaver somniferum TaxID=3469 RepID=A0A4Y7IG56_PAPSO|nr:hypothetical protein C5167_040800 [Papaver somniferum]
MNVEGKTKDWEETWGIGQQGALLDIQVNYLGSPKFMKECLHLPPALINVGRTVPVTRALWKQQCLLSFRIAPLYALS